MPYYHMIMYYKDMWSARMHGQEDNYNLKAGSTSIDEDEEEEEEEDKEDVVTVLLLEIIGSVEVAESTLHDLLLFGFDDWSLSETSDSSCGILKGYGYGFPFWPRFRPRSRLGFSADGRHCRTSMRSYGFRR
jgi:hypothetical protein